MGPRICSQPVDKEFRQSNEVVAGMASAGQQELTRAIPEAAAIYRLVRAQVLPVHQAMVPVVVYGHRSSPSALSHHFCLGEQVLRSSGSLGDLLTSPGGD